MKQRELLAKNSPKKICFLAGTLGQGGAERQLYYYLRALKSLNYDLCVLSLTSGEFWENKIRDLDIPVIYVGKSKSKIVRLITIMTEMVKHPVDILQSQHFSSSLYVGLVGNLLCLRSIGAIRNDVYSEVKSIGKILGYFCLHLPNFLVVNSNLGIKNAQSFGILPKKMVYLPNIVDADTFKPVLKRPSKVLRVCFVGTLWRSKRVDRILEVASLCLQANLNIEFNLYGDGILRDQLENDAKDKGVLNRNVFFHGRVADTKPVYDQSDALILLSEYEGTPNVVLEAMSSGLPIIATDVGDLAIIVKNGENGFIVPQDHFESAYKMLEILLNSYELRMRIGEKNRKWIEQYRSFNQLMDNLDNMYQQIL